MATIVNTPGNSAESNSMAGVIMAILLILAVVFGIWFFGSPYLRGAGGGSATVENNMAPPQNQGGTNINVPEKVDVNVQDSTNQ